MECISCHGNYPWADTNHPSHNSAQIIFVILTHRAFHGGKFIYETDCCLPLTVYRKRKSIIEPYTQWHHIFYPWQRLFCQGLSSICNLCKTIWRVSLATPMLWYWEDWANCVYWGRGGLIWGWGDTTKEIVSGFKISKGLSLPHILYIIITTTTY